MLKMGLDLGTGFVKCVSDRGSVRFPSVCVKRVHGAWSERDAEAVGTGAAEMAGASGSSVVRPISRGRPEPRYAKQAEALVREAVRLSCAGGAKSREPEKISMVVGLPYHAFADREALVRLVKRTADVEKCRVVAQACGTLVCLGKPSGISVSVGQGTTEIVVVEEYEVIDGDSSRWASDFVTRKIGKLAHLDLGLLERNRELCKKYSKILAENLESEVLDMADGCGKKHDIALSGGGLLLPGMLDDLSGRLKKRFGVLVPDDPVMSNAQGLYRLAR